MQHLGTTALAVLRAIHSDGPITIAELNQLPGLARLLPDTGSKPYVQFLSSEGLVNVERITGNPSRCTVTAKGLRQLNALEGLTEGPPPAAPRSNAMEGYYTGERATPSRAGALRAFELPSLQNDVRVPRARPMLIGAAARDLRR